MNNKVNLNKDKINKSFSKSSNTYDYWAKPQQDVAKQLISLIRSWDLSGKILDLGCGTGLLTNLLYQLNPDLDVFGIDISSKMIKCYSKINSKGCHGDMESLQFENNYFETTLSSFALHWTDLSKSIPELVRVTSKRFAITLPIYGSIPDFKFPFPKKEKIIEFLTQQEVKIELIETKLIPIPYQGLDLIKYFHYTGTTANPSNKIGLGSKKWIQHWIKYCSDKNFYFKLLYLIGYKIA